MRNFILLAALAFFVPAAAQTNYVKQLNGNKISAGTIDSIVNRLITNGKVDGLCVAVINDNKVVYSKGYGYKNAAEKSPMDTSTVMYAASFSKAVFAYINMRLVQKGLIDLDKPLYQYANKSLVQYGPYEDLEKDPRWKLITPRMCLSHTTGLPNLWFINVHTGQTDTTLTIKLHFNPGERYAYSGEGLKLLQRIEEAYFGKDLEKIAAEEIFIPAGMTRSSYVWNSSFESNSASGHDENGKAVGKQKSSRPGGAGSMLTTISDYGRFITYILNGKGLSPEYYKLMISSQVRIHSAFEFPTITDETTTKNDKIQLSYGLGWGVMQTKYGPAFFKEGHHDYWRNYNVNFPKKKTAIIIMSNSANGEGIFKELLEKLIGDVFTPWEWERYTPYDAVNK